MKTTSIGLSKQFNSLSLILTLLFASTRVDAQNTWLLKSNFEGGERYGAVGFTINNKGYIATGNDVTTGLERDLWEYDPIIDAWSQKTDLPAEERTYAVGFSIGNYGYVGTGAGNSNFDDFWQYDPVSNSWTQKADFEGGNRYRATGFSIGSKGYLGTGYNGNLRKKDFYEYDPATDTWTKKANVGGTGRDRAVSFVIGEKGYIGTAGTSDPMFINDLWEYDPAADTWTERATMPGPNRYGGVAFAIGGKGYVATGITENEVALDDVYEYDPLTDSWTQKPDLGGSPRSFAVGFAIGDKGYIGTGEHSDDIYLNDFWEFSTTCNVPTGLVTSNIKAASAKVNWQAEPNAQKYSVRYRKTGTATWSKTTALTNSKKLTGLTPSTQYDWSVKLVCDAVNNISSDWSATQNFTTKPLRLMGDDETEMSFEIYPNPLAGSTTVYFSIEENSRVTVELFDLAGRKIKTVADENFTAGSHEISLNDIQLSAGAYLLRLKNETHQSTLKAIVE